MTGAELESWPCAYCHQPLLAGCHCDRTVACVDCGELWANCTCSEFGDDDLQPRDGEP